MNESKLRRRLTGSLISVLAVAAALVPLPGLTNAAEAGTTTGDTYTSDLLGTGSTDGQTSSTFHCYEGMNGLATISDDDGYFLDKLTVRCVGAAGWAEWRGTGTDNVDVDWIDCTNEDAENNADSIVRGLRINARTSKVGAPDEIGAICSIDNSVYWLGDDQGDDNRPNVSYDGCPSDMIMDTITLWSGTITAGDGANVDGISNVRFNCSRKPAVS